MPRITRKPFLVSLFLSIATAFIILCCLSPGTFQHLHGIISSNLFLHLLFNSIIIVIVAKEHFRDSRNELDKGFLLFHFAYEMEERGGKIGSDDEDDDHINDLESRADRVNDRSDDNDNDNEDYDAAAAADDDHGSDGYDEDDDDNGSYAEMGWEDEEDEEEDCDSELERRVEAFIAKVINGWKEEWFSDNMQD